MQLERVKSGVSAAVLSFAALAAGCTSQVAPKADDYNADLVAYDINTKTGVCYSFMKQSRMDSGFKVSESVSHTYVPCTEKVLAQIPPARIALARGAGVVPANTAN